MVVAGAVGTGTGSRTGSGTGAGGEGFFSVETTGTAFELGLGRLAALMLDLCISAMMNEAMAPEATTKSQRGKRIAKLYTLVRILAK